MIPSSFVHACSVLLAHLIAPALRSLTLACFAALVLGAFRVRNIAARLAVWTAVLYVSLAMPLLGVVLPSVSLAVPSAAVSFVSPYFAPLNELLGSKKLVEIQSVAPSVPVNSIDAYSPKSILRAQPNRRHESAPSHLAPSAANSNLGNDSMSYAVPAAVSPANMGANARQPLPWIAMLSALYFAVAVVFLARLLLGIVLSRRLVVPRARFTMRPLLGRWHFVRGRPALPIRRALPNPTRFRCR